MRLVKDQLETAVINCIQGALNEWQPTVQKSLLRAAQLGKAFLMDQLDPEMFVNACRTLRILNAVRQFQVKIFNFQNKLTFIKLKIEFRLDCL